MSVIRYLLISFLMILLLNGCTDKLSNQDDTDSSIRWKAYFDIKGAKVPIIFTLDSIPLNIHGYRTIFIDGPITNQKEYTKIAGDSFINPLDYSGHVLLKGIIKSDTIKGTFEDKKDKNTFMSIPFIAYKTEDPRFSLPTTYTDINVTGQWEFTFSEQDSLIKFTKYSKIENFHLFQNEGTLIARTVKNEGFEGVMTKEGFICSSMTKDRPTLLQTTLIDTNHLEGTILTSDESFSFTAKRKSKLESTSENSVTLFKMLKNLFKAYDEYPK
ncbi:hypothetical protein LNQ81_12015 [Myroides sp. M-43]|uniref:hypothetical protein n=1 Tax=Myroides oncorhynchi TaxID=2893756 RepID=UPI001E31FBBA|nr:hypothetical protein [Myroides oncorhynchi]MCC9043395.1 hypothetical protein [Myroides oncorhynchi]